MKIGDTFKYRFDHLFQTVTCTATIVAIDGDMVTFRLPKRVTTLPFPPLWVNDHPTRYGKVHASKIPGFDGRG